MCFPTISSALITPGRPAPKPRNEYTRSEKRNEVLSTVATAAVKVPLSKIGDMKHLEVFFFFAFINIYHHLSAFVTILNRSFGYIWLGFFKPKKMKIGQSMTLKSWGGEDHPGLERDDQRQTDRVAGEKEGGRGMFWFGLVFEKAEVRDPRPKTFMGKI